MDLCGQGAGGGHGLGPGMLPQITAVPSGTSAGPTKFPSAAPAPGPTRSSLVQAPLAASLPLVTTQSGGVSRSHAARRTMRLTGPHGLRPAGLTGAGDAAATAPAAEQRQLVSEEAEEAVTQLPPNTGEEICAGPTSLPLMPVSPRAAGVQVRSAAVSAAAAAGRGQRCRLRSCRSPAACCHWRSAR